MAISLTKDVLVICEGDADKNFLDKLILERGIPDIDVLSADGIGGLTKRLQGIRGNTNWFANLKGVIIVADSGHNPASTMNLIRKLIKAAGHYALPSVPLKLTDGSPKIGVLLLPQPNQSGALESLCFDALVGRKAWLSATVDAFLGAPNIDAINWPAEKLAKARFGAAVAATFKQDPSKAVSRAFQSKPRKPALLSTKSPAFNAVERWLRDLAKEARL